MAIHADLALMVSSFVFFHQLRISSTFWIALLPTCATAHLSSHFRQFAGVLQAGAELTSQRLRTTASIDEHSRITQAFHIDEHAVKKVPLR